MKKVFGIVLLLVVLVSAMALAVEPNAQAPWRFTIKADDGLGSAFMAAGTIGVAVGAKDGFGVDGTASDVNDGIQNWSGQSAGARGVLSPFNNIAYLKNIQSPRSPRDSAYAPPNSGYGPYSKTWDMKVFNLPDPTVASNYIRLQFFTIAATQLPVATINDANNVARPAIYTLRMVNNKGVVGAPPNYDSTKTRAQNIALGSAWNIPIPTVHSTTIPYFTLTLPLRTLSATSPAAAMAEGYDMQFYQTPEPSSLMAMGAGLMGLIGFAARRRRS